MTTWLAYPICSAASAALVCRTVWSSGPPTGPAAAFVPPNPPATMAGIDRFIALAIRLVRIVPEAPTIMPATIIAVLSSASPVAAAESPVSALSSEITTGMSAPPIGSTTITPSTAAETRTPTISSSDRWPRPIATAHPTETSSSDALSGCCARPTLIGLPGNSSCSLPKAINDPQNDTDPTIAAKSEVTVTYQATVAYPWLSRTSTQDQRDTATT